MNKVMLVGRLTKDPEVRTTNSGMAYLKFTLAVNRNYKDANGQYQADFIQCSAMNKTAEYIGKYTKKGNQLGVVGSIQVNAYQDKNGQQQYSTEVFVENVENYAPKEGTPQGQQQQAQQPVYQEQPKPQQQPPKSFDVEVADDDLPF